MKIFRLDEATALLPTLRPLLDRLVRRRRDAAIALLEEEVARNFSAQAGGHDPLVAHSEARDTVEALRGLIEEIERHGCVVKDIDLGLVDFPALRGGELVNLCWKMDEPDIRFWHAVDEGFAARRPLPRKRT